MSEHNGHIGEEAMQRYLNGEMDAAEQHAFEKKLENDPFAYQAIEGLEGVSQAEVARELQKLQATETEQSFSWMKIAAAVTIALMSGLGIWYYSQPQTPAQLAYEETTAPVETPQAKTAPSTEPVAAPTLPETSSETIAEVNEAEEIELDEPIAITAAPALADVQSLDPPSQKQEDELPTLRNEVAVTLEENMADEDEEQFSEEILEETIVETVVDDIIFEEQVAQDFEVNSGAVADQQLSRTAPAAKSMSRQSFNATTPQPIGGLKAYQDYLTDSLRYTSEMQAGVVTLRFTIDQRGTPADIQVIQSLNETADMEAIRLVAEGPKWSRSPGIPMTLSVPIRPK
ncbi:MAG: energy transducer TonB [Cyclobacteriaceae bacterium]